MERDFLFKKKEDRLASVRFRDFVKKLKGDVSFANHLIRDENFGGGFLLMKPLQGGGGFGKFLIRVARQQPDKNGSVNPVGVGRARHDERL